MAWKAGPDTCINTRSMQREIPHVRYLMLALLAVSFTAEAVPITWVYHGSSFIDGSFRDRSVNFRVTFDDSALTDNEVYFDEITRLEVGLDPTTVAFSYDAATTTLPLPVGAPPALRFVAGTVVEWELAYGNGHTRPTGRTVIGTTNTSRETVDFVVAEPLGSIPHRQSFVRNSPGTWRLVTSVPTPGTLILACIGLALCTSSRAAPLFGTGSRSGRI